MKDLSSLLKQAQDLQAKMADMQAKLETLEVSGESGGGMVRVTLNGKGIMRHVNIDDSLMSASDREVLEDLLVAAHNDAKTRLEQKLAEEMANVTGGLGLPPGLKFPF